MLRKASLHHLYSALFLMLIFGTAFLPGLWSASHKNKHMDSTPGMDMSDEAGMRDMGPSMAAMAGHMIMTPVLPRQPGDEEKAWAVIGAAKATMERYKDYRKALADGYIVANPKVKQAQYHFMNNANGGEAEYNFDATKPTALLYRQFPHKMYKLEGVMYTAHVHATDDELNKRIPLSVARWHQHTNFCAAPANKVGEYFGTKPKFGMFGSIKTKEACDAEGGHFYAYLFNWMIHVFPYEKDFKGIFSMNDDIAHVR